MSHSGLEGVVARCPYCQGVELTRLVGGSSIPIDVFRCHGCGSQFNIDRLRDEDDEPQELMILAGR
jgi:transposase-like protein